MRAQNAPATFLLLLFTTQALNANRRKQSKDKYISITNICDITDRDSKIHCYCEQSQEINRAVKTECWVFNGGIEKSDPLWTSFSTQANIETLAFNVRADGGLDFVPTKVFRYLRKLRHISVKYSSIDRIESNTFSNLSAVQEMALTKNQITTLCKHSFNNLPNLTVLTLDENRIKELVTETFWELPSLQKLYLTSNNISVIHSGAFQHLINLSELELDRNNITVLSKDCFDGLANLKRLDLRKNKLTKLESFTFTELWNLQELLLDYNEISLLAQRTFDGLSQLSKLSLKHNKLVSLADGLFEGVRGLSALDLRSNRLKSFTVDDLRPIYDNLKNQNSYIYLEGNALNCDCHLAWMHKLRSETRSSKVRSSLENFVCKFKTDVIGRLGYFGASKTSTNHLATNVGKSTHEDVPEDLLIEDLDDAYREDQRTIDNEDDRILLQIPIELLPCPQHVKAVTERSYTYPSQNEAKDYRNLIKASSSCEEMNMFVFFNLFLLMIIH